MTGKSFLIADALTAESATPVLLHEVGIHAAKDASMQPVFKRAKFLADKAQNKFFDCVRARTINDALAPETAEYEGNMTGDLAEGLMRQTVEARQGKVDIRHEGGGTYIVVNRLKGQAVVLSLQGGFYSVTTVRPIGGASPTQLWGDPVLRNGRLAFPSHETSAASSSEQIIGATKPIPNRSGQDVRTEKFDITKPDGNAPIAKA